MGKTLGIIGKGKLIQHFFANLGDSAVHQDEKYNAKAFFSEIESVLFYGWGYESAADYEKSGGYTALHENLKKLNDKIQLEVTDTFADFFHDSAVIVDTPQGYIPGKVEEKFPHQEQRKGSLLEYIQQLIKPPKDGEKVRAENYSWKKDFKEYCKGDQGGGHILMTDTEFQTHWEDSKRIAEAIIGLKKDRYIFGPRTEMAFPFSVGMIQQRGEEINGHLHRDPVVNDPYIPTYINLVNEPCSSSNLLVGKCPELASYVVACTGYDLERITEQINKDGKVKAEIRAARKNGIKVPESFRIQLAYVWGAHDAHLIIPIFSAAGEHKDEAENILHRFNENSLYRAVNDAVGKYLKSALDINEEVDRCLLKTVLCAVRSRGKAFSVYPELSEQHPELSEPPLCNGYFQRSAGENTGMFLMGAHRFRNGKVLSEAGR